ncbi:hypothetical protein CPHO_07020 [Corynebacterium phocae]|uniref:Uncharacterized protein n=2 Tax=Corynebacterium phocae TaxID=161895 RepID=A0A1L7D3K5_9CORY|nr:hypothetical protein CPHO_07020 [Corynebacterium phocae]
MRVEQFGWNYAGGQAGMDGRRKSGLLNSAADSHVCCESDLDVLGVSAYVNENSEIVADVSTDPGDYLCNALVHAMYTDEQLKKIPAVFCHIPWHNKGGGDHSPAQLARGMAAVVEYVATNLLLLERDPAFYGELEAPIADVSVTKANPPKDWFDGIRGGIALTHGGIMGLPDVSEFSNAGTNGRLGETTKKRRTALYQSVSPLDGVLDCYATIEGEDTPRKKVQLSLSKWEHYYPDAILISFHEFKWDLTKAYILTFEGKDLAGQPFEHKLKLDFSVPGDNAEYTRVEL